MSGSSDYLMAGPEQTTTPAINTFISIPQSSRSIEDQTTGILTDLMSNIFYPHYSHNNTNLRVNSDETILDDNPTPIFNLTNTTPAVAVPNFNDLITTTINRIMALNLNAKFPAEKQSISTAIDQFFSTQPQFSAQFTYSPNPILSYLANTPIYGQNSGVHHNPRINFPLLNKSGSQFFDALSSHLQSVTPSQLLDLTIIAKRFAELEYYFNPTIDRDEFLREPTTIQTATTAFNTSTKHFNPLRIAPPHPARISANLSHPNQKTLLMTAFVLGSSPQIITKILELSHSHLQTDENGWTAIRWGLARVLLPKHVVLEAFGIGSMGKSGGAQGIPQGALSIHEFGSPLSLVFSTSTKYNPSRSKYGFVRMTCPDTLAYYAPSGDTDPCQDSDPEQDSDPSFAPHHFQLVPDFRKDADFDLFLEQVNAIVAFVKSNQLYRSHKGLSSSNTPTLLQYHTGIYNPALISHHNPLPGLTAHNIRTTTSTYQQHKPNQNPHQAKPAPVPVQLDPDHGSISDPGFQHAYSVLYLLPEQARKLVLDLCQAPDLPPPKMNLNRLTEFVRATPQLVNTFNGPNTGSNSNVTENAKTSSGKPKDLKRLVARLIRVHFAPSLFPYYDKVCGISRWLIPTLAWYQQYTIDSKAKTDMEIELERHEREMTLSHELDEVQSTLGLTFEQLNEIMTKIHDLETDKFALREHLAKVHKTRAVQDELLVKLISTHQKLIQQATSLAPRPIVPLFHSSNFGVPTNIQSNYDLFRLKQLGKDPVAQAQKLEKLSIRHALTYPGQNLIHLATSDEMDSSQSQSQPQQQQQSTKLSTTFPTRLPSNHMPIAYTKPNLSKLGPVNPSRPLPNDTEWRQFLTILNNLYQTPIISPSPAISQGLNPNDVLTQVRIEQSELSLSSDPTVLFEGQLAELLSKVENPHLITSSYNFFCEAYAYLCIPHPNPNNPNQLITLLNQPVAEYGFANQHETQLWSLYQATPDDYFHDHIYFLKQMTASRSGSLMGEMARVIELEQSAIQWQGWFTALTLGVGSFLTHQTAMADDTKLIYQRDKAMYDTLCRLDEKRLKRLRPHPTGKSSKQSPELSPPVLDYWEQLELESQQGTSTAIASPTIKGLIPTDTSSTSKNYPNFDPTHYDLVSLCIICYQNPKHYITLCCYRLLCCADCYTAMTNCPYCRTDNICFKKVTFHSPNEEIYSSDVWSPNNKPNEYVEQSYLDELEKYDETFLAQSRNVIESIKHRSQAYLYDKISQLESIQDIPVQLVPAQHLAEYEKLKNKIKTATAKDQQKRRKIIAPFAPRQVQSAEVPISPLSVATSSNGNDTHIAKPAPTTFLDSYFHSITKQAQTKRPKLKDTPAANLVPRFPVFAEFVKNVNFATTCIEYVLMPSRCDGRCKLYHDPEIASIVAEMNTFHSNDQINQTIKSLVQNRKDWRQAGGWTKQKGKHSEQRQQPHHVEPPATKGQIKKQKAAAAVEEPIPVPPQPTMKQKKSQKLQKKLSPNAEESEQQHQPSPVDHSTLAAAQSFFEFGLDDGLDPFFDVGESTVTASTETKKNKRKKKPKALDPLEKNIQGLQTHPVKPFDPLLQPFEGAAKSTRKQQTPEQVQPIATTQLPLPTAQPLVLPTPQPFTLPTATRPSLTTAREVAPAPPQPPQQGQQQKLPSPSQMAFQLQSDTQQPGGLPLPTARHLSLPQAQSIPLPQAQQTKSLPTAQPITLPVPSSVPKLPQAQPLVASSLPLPGQLQLPHAQPFTTGSLPLPNQLPLPQARPLTMSSLPLPQAQPFFPLPTTQGLPLPTTFMLPTPQSLPQAQALPFPQTLPLPQTHSQLPVPGVLPLPHSQVISPREQLPTPQSTSFLGQNYYQ